MTTDEGRRAAPALRAAVAVAVGAVGPIARFPEARQAITLAVLAVAVGVLGVGLRHRAIALVASPVVIGCLFLSWRGDYARAAAAVCIGTLIAECALIAWPPWRRGRPETVVPALALLIVAEIHWYLYGSTTGFAVLSAAAALVGVLWVRGSSREHSSLTASNDRAGDAETVPRSARLGVLTIVALRIKHAWRLGRDVTRFAADQGTWWLLPAILIIVALTALASATTATVPYVVYTLF